MHGIVGLDTGSGSPVANGSGCWGQRQGFPYPDKNELQVKFFHDLPWPLGICGIPLYWCDCLDGRGQWWMCLGRGMIDIWTERDSGKGRSPWTHLCVPTGLQASWDVLSCVCDSVNHRFYLYTHTHTRHRPLLKSSPQVRLTEKKRKIYNFWEIYPSLTINTMKIVIKRNKYKSNRAKQIYSEKKTPHKEIIIFFNKNI